MRVPIVRFDSPRSRSRLFAAVLISMALLLNVGCAASTNDDAGNAGPAVSTGALVSTKIADGQNPFAAAGIDDPQAFLNAFNAVKAAIAKGDKAEVANYILYPLRVNEAIGKHAMIQTRHEFVDQYDAIMTKAVKDAIANQNADHLFVNYQGVMVGNGEIWFGGSADTPQVIGMIAVNHNTGQP
ncbi:hypothetical protein [Paenibacillus glycinis]|uniref:Uncharacterized protein n=1 Tax=Paenibacillus glycinis TaxID=2697035 RepID=A0ABW9XVC3_9BACL|nr:hypothetical protein [Paenibacillus glycinis]NBD26641.1 hypothetical protein [Paenibacillus glycinis]